MSSILHLSNLTGKDRKIRFFIPMTFALVQKSLDQSIDRKTLEEASVHVPSVARGDCARLHRELFGIVVDGLPHDEAIAFQIALEHFNFPTEIVPSNAIPALPPATIQRGIRFGENELIALDGLGRENRYPWSEAQFAAGGFLNAVRFATDLRVVRNPNAAYRGRSYDRTTQAFVIDKIEQEVKELKFRFEIFLTCEPYRLQFKAGKDSLFRFENQLLRFHQKEILFQILQRIGKLFPKNRQSLAIQAATENRFFLYPSRSALEEEIVWHLFQQLRG